MQFTTALLTLTAAVATTVSAIPTSGPLDASGPTCQAQYEKNGNNDGTLSVRGGTFNRLHNIDFAYNDLVGPKPGPTYSNINSPKACAQLCVDWNANLKPGQKPCVGFTHLPHGTTHMPRANECWLKEKILDCGRIRHYFVTTGVLCDA